MKLGIINSAFGQAGVDTLTGLEHIARIGFDSVDIFTEPSMLSAEEISGLEICVSRKVCRFFLFLWWRSA